MEVRKYYSPIGSLSNVGGAEIDVGGAEILTSIGSLSDESHTDSFFKPFTVGSLSDDE